MQQVLIIIHLIIVLALVGVVLLQRSEGGGLGLGGGGGSGGVSGFMTGRGQANALTRATAILAALFFATSLLLSVLASQNRGGTSIFQNNPNAPAQTTPSAPGAAPNVLDQLRQLQGDAPTPSAVPAPSAPAPAAPSAVPAPVAPPAPQPPAPPAPAQQ